jgi:hypothetical protein
LLRFAQGYFMSATNVAQDAQEWINGADVLKRYPEISRVKLYRLAASQLIRVKAREGFPPLYHAEDAHRVISAQFAEG